MKRFETLFIGMVLLLAACQRPAPFSGPVEETRFLMDTVVRVALYDSTITSSQGKKLLDETFQLMAGLEHRLSAHVDSSEVSRINETAGTVVEISHDLAVMLNRALDIGNESGGAFDVTLGPVKALWKFDAEEPRVPPADSIAMLMQHTGHDKIVLETNKIRLDDRVQIDAGGLAKGYIIDRAVAFLKRQGVAAGLVDGGGDMRFFGRHPRRGTWKIGIRHPRSEAVSVMAVLETEAGSVATSGDYERYFILNGRRYHHLLDPQTGYPARVSVSATAVAADAVTADAWATALFVLGPERGIDLVSRLPGLEGVVYYEEEGKLKSRMSPGLKDKIETIKP